MRAWIRKYETVVQLILSLIGIILMLLAVIAGITGGLGLALFTIGTALTSSTFLSTLNSLFGVDVPTMIEEKIILKTKTFDMGLDAIHVGLGDEIFFERFSSAHSIDMMYNTAKNATYRYGDHLKDAIAKNGCNVRILIADPRNPIWNDPKICDALCPGTNIAHEIDDVISHVQHMVRDLVSGDPTIIMGGSIEIKTYPSSPTCSIVIVDHKFIRHTPYLPYFHSSEVPVFDFARRNDARAFERYERTFSKVWSEGESVYKQHFQ